MEEWKLLAPTLASYPKRRGRKPKIERGVCPRCGHRQVVQDPADEMAPQRLGTCLYCAGRPEEWDFLAQLQALPPETPVRLRCVWHLPRTQPDMPGEPCPGEHEFTLADLYGYYCVGGHGPNTYWLFCRFQLQRRCAHCDHWTEGYQWLTPENRTRLLALVPAPQPA